MAEPASQIIWLLNHQMSKTIKAEHMYSHNSSPISEGLRKQFSLKQLLLVMTFVSLLAVLLPNLLPATLYGDAHAATYSPHGAWLAIGYEDGIVRLWNRKTGGARSLKMHGNLVRSLAFSADGKYLASGSLSGRVCLYDVSNNRRRLELANAGCANSLAFSPDGRNLAAGNWRNSVVVWELESGAEISSLIGHPKSISAVRFSPDGTRLVSASEDHTAIVWDTADWSLLSTWGLGGKGGLGETVTAMDFSPNGKDIAFARETGGVTVWDFQTGTERFQLTGENERLSSVAYSPDGLTLATGSAWNNIFSLFPGNVRFQIMKRPDFVGVKLWDLATQTEKGKVSSNTSIWSIAIAPDNKSIVGSTENWKATEWNLPDLSVRQTLVARRPFLTIIVFVLGYGIITALLIKAKPKKLCTTASVEDATP